MAFHCPPHLLCPSLTFLVMETQLNMAHYAPRALLESEIKSQDDMSRASNNYAMSVESGEPELEIEPSSNLPQS